MQSDLIKQPFQGHTYEIFDDVVAIIDGKVGMSLTNSIEYWIKMISKNNGFSPKDKKWIYRDSIGYWDGYDIVKQEFIMLHTIDFQVALDAIRGVNYIPKIERESK